MAKTSLLTFVVCIAIQGIALVASAPAVEDQRIVRLLPTDHDTLPHVEIDLPTGGVELTEFLARLEEEIGLQIGIGESVRHDVERYGPRRIYITNPLRIERERLHDLLFSVLRANDFYVLQSGKADDLGYRVELVRPRYHCDGCVRCRWVEPEDLEAVANESSQRPVITSLRISRPWLDDFDLRLRKLVDRRRLACYTPIREIETLMLQGYAREVARLVRQIPESALIRENSDAAQDSRQSER